MSVLRVLVHFGLGAACLFAGVAAIEGEPIPRWLACAVLVAALGYVVEAFATLADESR